MKFIPANNVLLLAMLPILGSAQTAVQAHAASGANRQQLTGAWRLMSLEQPTADGKLQRLDYSGLLVFTPDGHISVQVMDHDPKAPATPYSLGGYEASYGTYDVDQSNRTFTFHVQGALVRGLLGKDLPRAFEIKGKTLTVKSTNPDEHWRVIWQRY